MENKNDYLINAKVSSLIAKYSIPCVISLLVAALYNIVDQLFIANSDYLGSYGNAANNVVFPLTMVALAIAPASEFENNQFLLPTVRGLMAFLLALLEKLYRPPSRYVVRRLRLIFHT